MIRDKNWHMISQGIACDWWWNASGSRSLENQMVILRQHCGNEGFKDYGERQILSALEHLQRENEEYCE